MIQVTEYEPLGKGKLRVRFDNGTELSLYRREAGRMKLGPQVWISEEAYQTLIHEVVGKRAKKRIMHLLEQMDRTEYQLRDKLAQGGYPAECIDDAVAYVKEYHYLDDFRYACNYIRYGQEKQSRRQLTCKLAQKGVDRDVIERALDKEYAADESAQIRKLLEKKHYIPEPADSRQFQRTYQYLIRRGFKSSDILREMKNFVTVSD